jgi:Cu+-exporting ATPase
METANFNIPSISCSACSGKIKEGIKSIKGVGNISIDLKSQNLTVEYNPSDIKPHDIKKHIYQMGYEIL